MFKLFATSVYVELSDCDPGKIKWASLFVIVLYLMVHVQELLLQQPLYTHSFKIA